MNAAFADEQRRVAWDAAVRNCVQGHGDCSFGGFSLGSLYWLTVDGCGLPHADRCAWCPEDAETGFAGWEPGREGDDDHRFLVPACKECAARWARIDPRWTLEAP